VNDSGKLSFAADIRPMFTETDVEHMKAFGLDLSDRQQVQSQADAIYSTLRSGAMPPKSSGEARWTSEMCEKFKNWRDQGCLP
jgi:hypothetical protein